MTDIVLKRAAVIVATMAILSSPNAHSQNYPSKPIQVFVSFAPGSLPDLLARGLGESLASDLRQAIVVVNREGASGTLGFLATANSAPDGYTLAFGPQGAVTIQPHLKRNLGYELELFCTHLPGCRRSLRGRCRS